jgi:hypothetical protein
MDKRKTFYQIQMENAKILSETRRISMDNLKRSFDTLEALEKPETLELVSTLCPEYSLKSIQDAASDEFTDMTKDSEDILAEMDIFVPLLAKNEIPKRKETPLFRQIWDGELYGEKGYEGMKSFLEELRSTNEKLKVDVKEFILSLSPEK